MNKIFIPQEWVQDYKNALFKKLSETYGHESACLIYDDLEDDFPNLDFTNSEYEEVYEEGLIIIKEEYLSNE